MSRRNRENVYYEYDNESPRPCSCERCKCEHCDVDKNVEVKNDGKCFIITIKHCP